MLSHTNVLSAGRGTPFNCSSLLFRTVIDGAFPGPNTGIGSNLVSPNGANGYRSSGVGLVFAAGSDLRFQTRDPNSISSSRGAVVVVDYTLTGYLK